MFGLIVIGIILALVGPSVGQDYQTYDFPIQDYEADSTDDDITVVSKRDLEFNQYVPSYRIRGEPTCDELRAMWRLSKREARRATTTNELPRTRPYSYGRLVPFAHHAPSRQTTYGTVVRSFLPSPKGSMAKLRNIMEPGTSRGAFNKLRRLLAEERPGVSSYGKFNEFRNLLKEEMLQNKYDNNNIGQTVKLMDENPDTRHSVMFYPRGNRRLSGFVGDIAPTNTQRPSSSVSSWHPIPTNRGLRSCSDVQYYTCETDYDCECNGQYRCNKGKCKVILNSGTTDRYGSWFNTPIATEDLGVWQRGPRRHQ